ncbi:MAG: 8-oxo-dGTP pyrophosphatase MutT (NUDIX family) [Flavobacteriaceae bacterium]|jgi:8-oxo-dGTP pyrophosphatase MutT (NUDIX family)|tara:strand:- start:3599 stop:4180 length:582 start_codon:yes stop_codon:yes gene_type:complete
MYQIFYKKKVILLTDVVQEESDIVVLSLKNLKFKKVIKVLNKKNIKSVHLFHKNRDKLLKHFFKLIPTVIAAGGKILNSKSDTLFIYRNDKWDLPKGKAEKNEQLSETAIREVIEETGIKGISITKPLDITYHIFKRNEEYRLKITYWFEMFSDYEGEFIPQLNEGISDVKWIKIEDLDNIKNNSYPNIKLLF